MLRFSRCSRRTVRAGLRWAVVLQQLQQPANGAVPQLPAAVGHGRPERRAAVAPAGLPSLPGQHAAADAQRDRVFVRDLEVDRLHAADQTVHQGLPHEPHLPAGLLRGATELRRLGANTGRPYGVVALPAARTPEQLAALHLDGTVPAARFWGGRNGRGPRAHHSGRNARVTMQG